MSYAQKKQLSGNPTVSVVMTVLVVGFLFYVLVSGLAFNVIKKEAQNLKTFNVEQPPPPPEKPPPPPKEVPNVPPPPVTPPSIIQPPIQQAPIVTQTTPYIPPTPPPITPPAPPQPPPPPHTVQHAQSARGNLLSLFSADDYPESALSAGAQGTTTVRFEIGTTGRITSCSVISSSGNSALDAATCRVLQSRARFTPAKDSNGNPTTDSMTQSVKWVLPSE